MADTISELLVAFGVDVTSLDKGLATAASRIEKFGRGMRSVGVGLTAAVTAPLVGIGLAAVKAADALESALVESQAIMGDLSDAARTSMHDASIEISRITTFTAPQAAEAFFFLASAGLDVEQSIAALPAVAKFAQAGMFDLALATSLAADSQSAVGLRSADAAENLENLTRVTDVLSKANILANANIQQFAEALTTRAGAAFRSVNKDVEEATAVLAAFAQTGIKGADAGTQLSIVMRDLQSKAIENRAAFQRFGVEVFDSTGTMRNFADVLEQIEAALAGASDEQKKMTLEALGFADRSVGALIQLLGMSSAIREYERALRAAGGTTDLIARKQLASFSSQLKLFRNELNAVLIDLGDQLIPILRELLDIFRRDLLPKIKEWIRDFAALDPETKRAIVGLAALAAAAGPVLVVMGQVSIVLASILSSVSSLVVILPKLIPVLAAMAPALATLAGIAAPVAVVGGALAAGAAINRAFEPGLAPGETINPAELVRQANVEAMREAGRGGIPSDIEMAIDVARREMRPFFEPRRPSPQLGPPMELMAGFDEVEMAMGPPLELATKFGDEISRAQEGMKLTSGFARAFTVSTSPLAQQLAGARGEMDAIQQSVKDVLESAQDPASVLSDPGIQALIERWRELGLTLDQINLKLELVGQISQGIGAAFGTLLQGIIQVAAGTASLADVALQALSVIVGVIIEIISKLIARLIFEVVNSYATLGPLGWVIGIGVAAAAVAATIALARSQSAKASSLAEGGIVGTPMLAVVGDAPRSRGPEVVSPLEDLREMLGLGIGGGQLVLNVHVGDERVAQRVIRMVPRELRKLGIRV